MMYTEIIPQNELRPYVRSFGLLEDDSLHHQHKTFKVIVDGSAGLVFQENPESFLYENKGKLPQLFLHGLTTSNSQKIVQNKYRNIYVQLEPTAIKSIFGMDASELTDKYIDLKDIVKNDLTEQLLNVNSFEKRVKIISDFLLLQIAKNKHRENLKTLYAIGKINTENNDSLLEIQTALNISERSLERIFKSDVGISPKLFFRICRFQAALESIREGNFTSLTEIAYQHAYADQSHFNREFLRFSGMTPKQFLSKTDEQSPNFPELK